MQCMRRAPSGIQQVSRVALHMPAVALCMPLVVHSQVLSAEHRCTAHQVGKVQAVPGTLYL
eukprot:6931870-Alexandrium_andersonii.AAC.1